MWGLASWERGRQAPPAPEQGAEGKAQGPEGYSPSRSDEGHTPRPKKGDSCAWGSRGPVLGVYCSKTPWLKQQYKCVLSHQGAVIQGPPGWVSLTQVAVLSARPAAI